MLARHHLIVIIAVACLAVVGLQYGGQVIAAALAKCLASTAFVLLALDSGAVASRFGRLILLGLALSWCGDMFLVGTARSWFLAGLGAFLLAHVAYVTAFIVHGFRRPLAFVAAVPVTLIAVAVWAWLQPVTPDSLSIPVRMYIAVISMMVIFAYGTLGAGGSRLIAAGATLFFLSDLSVAALRLAGTDTPTYALGLPAYYAAQVCLALSVAQSRSH